MGDCRGLKFIYRSDAHKRQRGGEKDGDKNDRQDDKRPDEEDKTEEERDKEDPSQLTRTLIEVSAASLVGKLP
jgi:hypothetical protein